MSKAKQKFNDEQQEQIDEGWRLFNNAMEACEELEGFLHDLGEELGIDTSRAGGAADTAKGALDAVYSHGELILPKHSNEVG